MGISQIYPVVLKLSTHSPLTVDSAFQWSQLPLSGCATRPRSYMPWKPMNATILTLAAGLFMNLFMPESLGAQTVSESSGRSIKVESHDAPWLETSDAQWVWPAASAQPPNQYVHLLQDFEVSADSLAGAKLAISADSNYAVWINGEFAGFGQWSNFPDDKTYDVIDISDHLQPGANRIGITGYWQGESSSTYRPGAPGVVFAIQAGNKVLAHSGEGTRMRPAPNYVSGPYPKVTGQLGFAFEHRGDKLDGWLTPGYVPGEEWKAPSADELKPLSERSVRSRPIAKLLLQDRLPMKIVSQGAFTRTNPTQPPADAIQSDALAWRAPADVFAKPQPQLDASETTGVSIKPEVVSKATGAYIVLDTGFEEAGLLELEMDAPKGTVVDVGYGEHLEDLRVRASVGGRQFAIRHTTPAGHHTFLHPFLRLAGRYLQVHITPPAGYDPAQPIILKYAGLRPTPFPVEHRGSFETSDTLHNKIWEVSRRTLELCMHEHYEDCPWREQALYAMDARNQALAGYYCFGNYDFARESIKLLGQGYNKSDGLLELCAPADVGVNIPSFSLAWILMVNDYLLFSGDREFAKSQLPLADKLLQNVARESSGPVIGVPDGKRMWNFYEWAPGLDGAGVSGGQTLNPDRLEAPLNLFYLLALDAAARIADETGGNSTAYRTRAADLRAAFADAFWDEKERAFRTAINDDAKPHYAELTQALAILAGVVPPAELDALRARLASDNNGLVPCTISHTLYKFEALLTDKERYAPRVFDLIARDWGYMLRNGATSFWETIDGASAFADAGSLCHGWSGIPAWFYGAYVLGVKPTKPGFAEYESDPIKNVFTTARGQVPTPSKTIEVAW